MDLQETFAGNISVYFLHLQEYESLSAQRDAPLEGSNRDRWICFERVVWVQDVFTSGTREFFTQEDAQHFRRSVENKSK